MTEKEKIKKQNWLLESIEELVQELIFFSGDECEKVFRDDVDEIFTDDFSLKLAKKFKEELSK